MTKSFIEHGVGTLDAYMEHRGISGNAGDLKGTHLAQLIDHTALKPETPEKAIVQLCKEARENQFKSVCINPSWIPVAAKELKGSGVLVCTVIGFPLGANSTSTKVHETGDAVDMGADEIDMVINVGALKSKNHTMVGNEIKAVVKAARGKLVKVILETCLLEKSEIELACKLSLDAGAHYVKTSTGFSTGGATVEDIALMRKTVGNAMGVKASGGVRDYKGALAMLQAGATRIGASAGISIVHGGAGVAGY